MKLVPKLNNRETVTACLVLADGDPHIVLRAIDNAENAAIRGGYWTPQAGTEHADQRRVLHELHPELSANA